MTTATYTFEWVRTLSFSMAIATFRANFCILQNFFGVSKPLALEATNRVRNIQINFDTEVSNFDFLWRGRSVECYNVFRLWPSSDHTDML